MRERFALFGYVKVSGLLSAAEADEILHALGDVTGYTPDVYPWVKSHKLPQYAAHNYALEIPIFRKLGTHPRLLKLLRTLVGDVKLLKDGISAMWTAAGMHRDSHFPMDDFADEPIFSDSPDRHSVTRVLVYFLPPGVNTSFAVIPCSHKLALSNINSGDELTINDLMINDVTQQEIWLPISHGDCVIFDSRLKHMGPPLGEPRYMINYSYSLPNDFGREVWYYRRYVRTDLGVEPWSSGVEADLKSCNLWFDSPEPPEFVAAMEEKYKNVERGQTNLKLKDRVIARSLRPSRYLEGSRYAYLNELPV